MATRQKTDNVFQLTPLSSGTRLPSTGRSLVPQTGNRAMTRRERKTLLERDYQEMLIQAQEEKTRVGQQSMANLTYSASAIFVDTIQEIWGLRVAVQDPELQLFVTTFLTQQIKMTGVYLEEATAEGNNQILREIERTLRVEIEKRQPGFWASRFGRRNDDDES